MEWLWRFQTEDGNRFLSWKWTEQSGTIRLKLWRHGEPMNTFCARVAGAMQRIALLLLVFVFFCPSVRAQIGVPARVPSLFEIGEPLLQWVDLSRPELEDTRNLISQGRREEALRSLLLYFRSSQRPRLFQKPPEPDLLADTLNAMEILERKVTIEGETVPLESWNQVKDGDETWNWEMQRHAWWAEVARAYFNTHEEQFAEFLDGMIVDWFLSNPRPAQDVTPFRNRPIPTAWRTIDVGTRLADHWPDVFYFLRDSPSWTDESLAAFLRSVHEQADYLVRYPKTSKWLLVESSGLLTAALMFPEFLLAEEWKETAQLRLDRLATDLILPDGSHAEGSVSYLIPCLKRFTRATQLLQISGWDPSPNLLQACQLGFEYLIGIAEPNLFLPAINDSDRFYLPDVLNELGENVLPLPEIEYIRSERSGGVAPPSVSAYYPIAGHFVFRDGWERESLYALFDVGIFGNGLAHEDRLQFELAAFGETLTGDMGRSTNKFSPASEYFMGTEAHNCILIDSRGMFYRSTPPTNWLNRKPLECPAMLESEIQWAQATYSGPWKPASSSRGRAFTPATAAEETEFSWTRRFTFVNPSDGSPAFWVVSDRIEGKGKHVIDQLLAFLPGQLSVNQEEHRVYFQRNGVNLVAQSLAKSKVKISMVEGRERPFRGWFSSALGIVEPAPSVYISGTANLPERRDILIMPYRCGESCPLLSAKFDEERLICETTLGRVEVPLVFAEDFRVAQP